MPPGSNVISYITWSQQNSAIKCTWNIALLPPSVKLVSIYIQCTYTWYNLHLLEMYIRNSPCFLTSMHNENDRQKWYNFPRSRSVFPYKCCRYIFCLKIFHKDNRSWVENECRCPRTVGISNVDFTKWIYIFAVKRNDYTNGCHFLKSHISVA